MVSLEDRLYHKKVETIFDASRGLVSYAFRDKCGELFFAHLIDKAERFVEYIIFPINKDEFFKLRFDDIDWKNLLAQKQKRYKYFLSYCSKKKGPLCAVTDISNDDLSFLLKK